MNFSAPAYVPIEITSKCNLRCKHCYGNFPRHDRRDMSFSEIEIVIKKLYYAGVFRFEIGGGEPSIRADFPDILEIFNELDGVSVTVVTNGILYTDELINRISSIRKKLIFHVSMDGYDDKSYALLRDNRGAFFRVIENTRKMLNKGIDVRWNFAIGKKTLPFLTKTIQLAEQTGVTTLRLMILYNTGRASEDSLGFNYFDFQSFLYDFVNDKYTNPKVKVSLALTQPFEYAIPLLDKGIPIDIIKKKLLYESCMEDPLYTRMTNKSCTAGRTLAAVDSEGFLHYCCMLTNEKDTIGGNLINEDFFDIWNKSAQFNYIRNIKLEDLNTNCYLCQYKEICGGGCRARALFSTGDFLGPDPLCPFSKYEKKNSTIRHNPEESLESFAPEVFSIYYNNLSFRVRKEKNGASVFNSNENCFSVNQHTYSLLKLFKKYGSINEVKKALINYDSKCDVTSIENNLISLLKLLSDSN
ncbi:MAG: radical SAM protein [Lachnospiraceae bacterium]|nr:radical SAM protein [Lachnospiraceae bacterium]